MSLEDSIQDVYRYMNAQLIVEIINAIRFDPLRDMESFMRGILFAYGFGREHQIRLLYRQFATATRIEANGANGNMNRVNTNVDEANINGMNVIDTHVNGSNIHVVDEAYTDEAELANGVIADTELIDGFHADEIELANGVDTTQDEMVNGPHTEEESTGLSTVLNRDEDNAALPGTSSILQETLIKDPSDVVVVRPMASSREFVGEQDANPGARSSASFPNLRDAAQADAEWSPKSDPGSKNEWEDGFSTHERINRLLRISRLLWTFGDMFLFKIDPNLLLIVRNSALDDDTDNIEYVQDRLPAVVPTLTYLGTARTPRYLYCCVEEPRGGAVILEQLWLNMSTRQKEAVRKQLIDILRIMRAIEPEAAEITAGKNGHPPIGGFRGGPCKAARRKQKYEAHNAIYDEATLNDFVCSLSPHNSWVSILCRAMREDHRLVFTHGCLHPRNIMVEFYKQDSALDDQEILVTALINWDLAGWYPEHWEYVQAMEVIDHTGPLADWHHYLPSEAIGEWISEMAVDMLIHEFGA